MAKKTEEKAEVTEVIPETEEPKAEAEVAEEPKVDFEALVAERVKAEVDRHTRGLNRVIGEKDKEISRLKSQSGSSKKDELLLEMLKEGGYDSNPRIAQLEAELAKERQRETWERAVEEEKSKLASKIEAAGLDPDDEMFDNVKTRFQIASYTDGNFDEVHKSLDKLLSKHKPSEVSKEKETEEERINRLAEEKHREWLKKEHPEAFNKADIGLPSGSIGLGGLTPETIREKMKDRRWFKEHEEELDRLHGEGKL